MTKNAPARGCRTGRREEADQFRWEYTARAVPCPARLRAHCLPRVLLRKRAPVLRSVRTGRKRRARDVSQDVSDLETGPNYSLQRLARRRHIVIGKVESLVTARGRRRTVSSRSRSALHRGRHRNRYIELCPGHEHGALPLDRVPSPGRVRASRGFDPGQLRGVHMQQNLSCAQSSCVDVLPLLGWIGGGSRG